MIGGNGVMERRAFGKCSHKVLKSLLSSRLEEIHFLQCKSGLGAVSLISDLLAEDLLRQPALCLSTTTGEAAGLPGGTQVKGQFPLQGYLKTKAKISI